MKIMTDIRFNTIMPTFEHTPTDLHILIIQTVF